MEWINGEYIRQVQNSKLKTQIADFYKSDEEVLGVINKEDIDKIIELAKTRMKTLADFKNLVIPNEIVLSKEEKKIANQLSVKFGQIKNWNKEEILTAMKEVIKENKIKGNILYKIITGFESGLPLPQSLEILGKEKTLKRLEQIV